VKLFTILYVDFAPTEKKHHKILAKQHINAVAISPTPVIIMLRLFHVLVNEPIFP
jgi:hypothetical protein